MKMKAQKAAAKKVALAVGTAVAMSVGLTVATTQAEKSADLGWITGPRVNSRSIERGIYGAYDTAQIILARSPYEWNLMAGGLAARSAEELVGADWVNCSVVLVALGTFPTARYQVQVTEAHARGRVLLLKAVISLYRPETQVVTSPYDI